MSTVHDLKADQQYQTADGDVLSVKIDDDTKLEIVGKKLKIISDKKIQVSVEKQQAVQTEGNKTEEKKSEANGEKGDGMRGGSGQKEQGTERMLQNAITKFKNYKGIVITALIAVSLGFFLRRKFKGSVPH